MIYHECDKIYWFSKSSHYYEKIGPSQYWITAAASTIKWIAVISPRRPSLSWFVSSQLMDSTKDCGPETPHTRCSCNEKWVCGISGPSSTMLAFFQANKLYGRIYYYNLHISLWFDLNYTYMYFEHATSDVYKITLPGGFFPKIKKFVSQIPQGRNSYLVLNFGGMCKNFDFSLFFA